MQSNEPKSPHPPRPLLPPDYLELDPAAQRRARVAACTPPPDATPEEFERAHGFFCDLYLGRKPGGPLPEGFYYRNLVPGPVPEFHRRIVRDFKRHPKSIVQWPRKVGKSTVVTQSMSIWLALTRKIDIVVVTIAESKVPEIMDDIAFQLRSNPLIKADFGDVHARRHEGLWGHRRLTLRNRSKISCVPWKSSSLIGLGPDLLIIDDIEHHDKARRDPEATRDKLDDWFSNVIHPMIQKKSSLIMISTLSRRDFFAYYIAHVKVEDDPRWEFFHRTTLEAEWTDERTGERVLLWPEKWPADYLDAQRRALGDAAYAAQYLNRPGASDVCLFDLDPRMHLWSFSGGTPAERAARRLNRDAASGVVPWAGVNRRPSPQDFAPRPHPSMDPDPLESDGIVSWCEPDASDNPVRRESLARDLFQPMFRAVAIDFAPTQKASSDYSGCLCVGIDHLRRMWGLDLWLGKVSEEELLQRSYAMASRWAASMLVVEDVGQQVVLRERAAALMMSKAAGGGHSFAVVGTRYRGLDKGARISGMQWRFGMNCLLLPDFKDQHWGMMRDQIRLFTPDLTLLEHDDAIDMLSMFQFCDMGVGKSPAEAKGATPWDMVASGRPTGRDGTQHGLSVKPSPELTRLARMARERMRGPAKGKGGGGKWVNPRM